MRASRIRGLSHTTERNPRLWNALRGLGVLLVGKVNPTPHSVVACRIGLPARDRVHLAIAWAFSGFESHRGPGVLTIVMHGQRST